MAARTSEAWATFQGLLESPDERIRLRACVWFLDRALSIISVDRLLEDGSRPLSPMPSSLTKLLDGDHDEERGEVG